RSRSAASCMTVGSLSSPISYASCTSSLSSMTIFRNSRASALPPRNFACPLWRSEKSSTTSCDVTGSPLTFARVKLVPALADQGSDRSAIARMVRVFMVCPCGGDHLRRHAVAERDAVRNGAQHEKADVIAAFAVLLRGPEHSRRDGVDERGLDVDGGRFVVRVDRSAQEKRRADDLRQRREVLRADAVQ